MTKIALYISIVLLLNSCAFHSGNISTGPDYDCPLVYNAYGSARTFHVFGIGGLNKTSLIMEAKNKLRSSLPKNDGIKITNYSVDYIHLHYLIFLKIKAIVTADVFYCGNEPFESLLNKKVEPQLKPVTYGFFPSDTIFYSNRQDLQNFHLAIFNSFAQNNEASITFIQNQSSRFDKIATNNEENLISKKITIKFPATKIAKLRDIYQVSKHPENTAFFGFDVGENALINVYSPISRTVSPKSCTIIGLNIDYVIVEYLSDDKSLKRVNIKKSLLKKIN